MKNIPSISAESFRKTNKILIIIYPLLAIVIAIGFFLAMKSDFEPAIGHFKQGSVGFIMSIIGIAVSAALAFIYSRFMTRSLAIVDEPHDSTLDLFGSIFGAAMAIITALFMLAKFELMTIIEKGAAIFLFALAGSLILGCVSSMRTSKIRSLCAVLGALSINLTIFSCYFDLSLPLNSPIRNLLLVAQLSALLFLLSEARLTFGAKSGRSTVSFAYLSSALAATITLGYSLGGVLVYLFAPLKNDPNPMVSRLGLYIAIGVIAIGRLAALPSLSDDKSEGSSEDADVVESEHEAEQNEHAE